MTTITPKMVRDAKPDVISRLSGGVAGRAAFLNYPAIRFTKSIVCHIASTRTKEAPPAPARSYSEAMKQAVRRVAKFQTEYYKKYPEHAPKRKKK